jgi:hypothetical protein
VGAPDVDRLGGVRGPGAGARPGDSGYIWSWAQSTFENWQSEFLQVFVFIVLTTFLVHRKSHESPDTDYDSEASLRRLEAKLDALEQKMEKS